MNPEGMYKSGYNQSDISHAYNYFLTTYNDKLGEARRNRSLDSVYLAYYQYSFNLEQNKFLLYSTNQTEHDKKLQNPIVLDDAFIKYISYYNSPLAAHTKGGANYKQIAYDPSIPPQSKKLILYYCLRLWNMPGYFHKTKAELEPYYQIFVSVTEDIGALEYLKSEFGYLYQPESVVSNGDTFVLDTQDNVTTFESILANNRGKVIYVDFWASWCSPCVGSLPSALKLREQYKDQDVVFVYLCLNDKKEAWEKAIVKYRLDYLCENYFILDADAHYLKNMRIATIPRYLLYDKDGTLVNANAPRPNDSQIITEINNHL